MPPVEAPPPPQTIVVRPYDHDGVTNPYYTYNLRLSKRGYGRPWKFEGGFVWWQQLPEGNYLPWIPRIENQLDMY